MTPPLPTPRYARSVRTVMVVMYTCNDLDRFVPTILITDIERDLGAGGREALEA